MITVYLINHYHNSSITLTDGENKKTYYGYNRLECVKLFRQEFGYIGKQVEVLGLWTS